MKLLFITSNKGKLEWAKRRLKNYNIELIQKILPIEESRHVDVEQVALDKAEKASISIKEPFIIEDSGFCIKALNEFPATQIKFMLKTIGIKGIIKLMKGIKNRGVIFKSALIFVDNKTKKSFICNDNGMLPEFPRGENLHGFNELFKIFIPKGFTETLAEMSEEEYKIYEKGIKSQDHYVKFAQWFKENKNE